VKNEIEQEYNEGLLRIQQKPIVERRVEVEGVVTEAYTVDQKALEIEEYKKPYLSIRIKWADRDEKEGKEWDKECECAKAWLREHIDKKYHNEMKDLLTPKAIWDYCSSVIGKNQMSGDGVNLYLDLINDSFKEGEPLVDLCTRMKDTYQRIKDLGYTDEALISLMVIAKMPEELEFHSMLLNSKYEPKELTIAKVKEVLAKEDKRRDTRMKETEKAAVVVNNVNTNNNSNQRKCTRKKCKCYLILEVCA
jgi:hypothetical protein